MENDPDCPTALALEPHRVFVFAHEEVPARSKSAKTLYRAVALIEAWYAKGIDGVDAGLHRVAVTCVGAQSIQLVRAMRWIVKRALVLLAMRCMRDSKSWP